jgi:hypothetical protein
MQEERPAVPSLMWKTAPTLTEWEDYKILALGFGNVDEVAERQIKNVCR